VIDYIRRNNIREFAMPDITCPASLGKWSAYAGWPIVPWRNWTPGQWTSSWKLDTW